MANYHRGEVEIILDKPRILKYKFNSIVRIEKELGCKIQKVNPEDWGFEEMRILLWAGLLHDNKDLTVEEAGDLADYASVEEVMEKVGEAINLVFQKGSTQIGTK